MLGIYRRRHLSAALLPHHSLRSAMTMDSSELTAALPHSSVHRSRFPVLRTGQIAAAQRRSRGEPAFLTTSSWPRSRPMMDSVRPEKHAEPSTSRMESATRQAT
jgi:hypothetical protein